MALDVLPRQLISESARSLDPAGVKDPESSRVGLVQAQVNHREVKRRYRLDMAWRVPAAAAYVVAGLAGSVFAPNMAAMGARGAMATSEEEGLLPPRLGVQAYLDEIRPPRHC